MDADIIMLNRLYLQKARERLIPREDHKVQYLLGMPPEAMGPIRAMSLSQLKALTESGILCFSFRVPHQTLRDLLLSEEVLDPEDPVRLQLLAAAATTPTGGRHGHHLA